MTHFRRSKDRVTGRFIESKMIASIKRRASRVNLASAQFLFSVRATQLVISDSSSIEPGSILTICLEKGGKISTSNQFVYDATQNDINPISSHDNLRFVTIPMDERMELVITLYRSIEGDQRFQVKTGRLILRQLKHNSSLSMDAFKSIGSYSLALHELALQLGQNRMLSQEVLGQLQGLPGSSINFTLTVRRVREVPKAKRNSLSSFSFARLTSKSDAETGDEAARSDGSDDSEDSHFSALGATFYYDDLDPYAGAMDSVVSTLGVVRGSIGEAGATLSPSRSGRPPRRSMGPGEWADLQDLEDGGGLRGVGSARRRSSGVHVMEVALQEGGQERSHHRPLGKRPSYGRPSTGIAAAGAPTAQNTEGEDELHEPPPDSDPAEAAEAGPGEEAASQSQSPGQIVPQLSVTISPTGPAGPARTPLGSARARSRGHSYASSAGRPSLSARDEDSWEPVLATTEQGGDAATTTGRRSLSHSSPACSPYWASRRSLQRRSTDSGRCSTPLSNLQPTAAAGGLDMGTQCDTAQSSPMAGRRPSQNEETFALYVREIEAQSLRIAELEQRLMDEAARHRSELAEVQAALHTAEVELSLLRPLHLSAAAQQQSRHLCAQCSATIANDTGDGVPGDGSEQPISDRDSPSPPIIEESQAVAMNLIDAQQSAEEAAAVKDVGAENHQSTETSRRDESVDVPPMRQSMIAAPAAGDDEQEEDDFVPALPAVTTVEPPVPPPPANAAAVAALVSEYGRSSAEVKLLAQELLYYKQLAAEAQRAKAEETMAAREAATVAVQAHMRRADCEQELADALAQVQDLHRRVHLMQIEHDDEVRRNYVLKARLQLYAQKMSAMEVDFSLSMCQLEEAGELADHVAEGHQQPASTDAQAKDS